MRLVDLLEANWEMLRSGVDRQELERMMDSMAKRLPSEGAGGTERADWQKDVYVVKLVKQEIVENKYYRSEEHMRSKHGEPDGVNAAGVPFWEKDGKREYPSFIEDAMQYSLTFEVVEGEKQGDWLFVYASPRYWKKGDGWGGKIADIYLAADPSFDLSEGYEDDLSDIMHKPLRVAVEPKDDPQYAKVSSWMPVRKGYAPPENPPSVSDDDDEIPF